MKHISIGGLDVSRIGLGAMSVSGYYNIGVSAAFRVFVKARCSTLKH